VILVVLSVPVVGGYVAAPTSPAGATDSPEQSGGETIVTIDATGPGQLVVLGGDAGSYRNRTYALYHDVDPNPGDDASVTYVASNLSEDVSCPVNEECLRNVVERVDLTTGNVTRLYSRVSVRNGSSQIHDVDRVNESVLLVGDIGPPDRVYMVNTTTSEVIWEWRVAEAYAPESGGQYPGDWTHLNDVEYLPDGRVMVSLRNQDQVVFVEPGLGLDESWTLGCDDCHGILYEQHNPDYIPREHGGPAVLVADSENNRIVEYQRVGTGWDRSWLWTDTRLQWPRDADRLPNGNTLIVDSHGQRLLEVAPDGGIVRRYPFPDGGYDAERLGTGPESTGGPSTAALRERSPGSVATDHRQDCAFRPGAFFGCVSYALVAPIPNLALHGLLFALPTWVTPLGGAALIYQVLVGLVWIGTEGVARRYAE